MIEHAFTGNIQVEVIELPLGQSVVPVRVVRVIDPDTNGVFSFELTGAVVAKLRDSIGELRAEYRDHLAEARRLLNAVEDGGEEKPPTASTLHTRAKGADDAA